MKHLCLPAALVLLATTAFSQPPDTLWTRTVSSDMRGEARALCLTQDGGYAVAGICCGCLYSGTFYYSAFVTKLNRSGQIVWQWQRNYAMETNIARDIIETPDGGLVVVGNYGLGGYDADIGLWAARLNAQGEAVWNHSYYGGDTLFYGGRAVRMTPDGGYLIAGVRNTSLCKLDSAGNMLWQRNWGIAFQDITATPDGNFVCVGQSESGGSQCIIAKVTPDGDSLWSHDCGAWCTASVQSVITTYDGGLAICGSCNDMFLALLDSSGNHLLTRRYEFDSSFAMSLCQTYDSGFVLVGRLPVGVDTVNTSQLIIIRTEPDADVKWVKYWGGGDSVCANAVLQDIDSGFVIAGRWNHNSWYVVKLAAESLPISERIDAFSPESISISSFPNPFNPSTTLSFSLPHEARARIAVFDLLGREVAVLADERFTAGEHHVTFNGSSLPSGLYFARLQSGDYIATHKLLLLK
jgi:hypothetical protein